MLDDSNFENGDGEGKGADLFPETRQRLRESFSVYKRYGSLKNRGDGAEMCRTRAGVGLNVERRAAR